MGRVPLARLIGSQAPFPISIRPNVYRRALPCRSPNGATASPFAFPSAVVEALELKAGDDVGIRVADRRELVLSRKPGREGSLKRLRSFRGRLPAGFRFDRDEANAR
jgi:antitoxin MazE